MRIIHFSQDFRSDKPQLGGYSRIVNIAGDGNIHYIFTIGINTTGLKVFNINEKITVVELPIQTQNFNLKSQIINLKKISKGINRWLIENGIVPDLFFGHSQLVNFFVLSDLNRRFIKNTPIIWEMNAIWGLGEKSSIKLRTLNYLLRYFQGIALRKASFVICQTESSAKVTMDYYNISSNKIGIVNNAVLSSDFHEKTREIGKGSNLKFLCIGRFDEMNGIPFLINSIKESKLNFNVSFYGAGDHIEEIRELEDLGRCAFGGSLSRAEMILKFRDFDFLIIPRLSRIEADLFIPTKLVEAMANGVVPICSDVKGMTEVVSDNLNGFLFKAGVTASFLEVIERCLKLEKDEYEKIQGNAIETIKERYVWEENYKILNEVYSRLIT